MKDNPLSRLAPALLVLNAATTIYEVTRDNIHTFSVIATIASVVLFVLYRRQSPHAASFLFWTTLPIFPLYFSLAALGVVGEKPTRLTLVVAAAIWLGGTIYTWRVRRKYAAHIG